MKAKCLFFVVVMLVLYVMTEAEFSPVKWSPSLSEQCGEHGNPDLSGVLTTVAEMIVNNKDPSSLPKSCMEIKESSPVSPSGYYTISNESGASGVIVYCNMNDLSSCPALEQTLSGIKKDVESLFTHNDGLALEQTLSEIKENVDSLFTRNDSLAMEQTLSGLKEDVDSLFIRIDGPLVSSCLDVKERCPQCESGIYEIGTDANNVNFVDCAFENTYCDITGPWVKLASWNITESDSTCPSGLQLFVEGTFSACGLPDGTPAGCQSLPLFSSPVQYTQVCGSMRGYQKGSTDAFWGPKGSNIDDPYVDGASITRGSPRQHIWTYASGVQENNYIPYQYQCPCVDDSTKSTPSFVGSDYYCESGCPDYWNGATIYSDDPLWDGEGCGSLEPDCCTPSGMPWFYKVLDAPTSDYIEMRMCTEEGTGGENVLISYYEIYVL